MNSAVIMKSEYMLPGDADFTTFDMIPESGKLNQDIEKTTSGNIYKTTVDFLIAGIAADVDQELKSLDNRLAYFKFTDADSVVYLVGTSDYPARLNSIIDLGGTPGSFKGYRCSVSLISPSGCTIQ